ncbi:MAG TPA: acyl-CoA dehydrogenase family protein [Aliidongia sp.]|nr:acyl-CoA dehydrogenase family protein [Aliidongia sp.]
MKPRTLTTRAAVAARSAALAPDCRGLDFWAIDRSLRDLLPLYIEPGTFAAIAPHLARLGALAGGRLDALAETAEKHPPVLHARDRYGRDEEWIEFHPAYREMEEIAFGDFGLHAMTHRPVLGLAAPLPPIAKYAFTYLFVQAEFGLLCPVNLTDSASELVARHGSEALKEKYLARMWSGDMAQLLRAAQFMTEKTGGSDVGLAELTAVRDGEHWRLWGEKWFCSNADADLAVLLARPEGAPDGTRGLGLFLMPRLLDDGTRNAYRVVRLKDKLGSRSMASGEILFEGAIAYPLGALDQGLKQMLEMVNSSRLSHAARAAGLMRRCLNEAFQATRHRNAFGQAVIEHPLMRRQLMKLLIPTEQALSALLFTAEIAGRSETDPAARQILRLMTPIVKYRTCRDNIPVATGALEARGGNGYIEDWVNARLVRDAHLGVLWEGTSNINGLDAIRRAVGKERAETELQEALMTRLDMARGLPGQFRTRLETGLGQAVCFAREVAGAPENERFSREAASALYHAATALLMALEGLATGAGGGDARRLLMARFVIEHRLCPPPAQSLSGRAWEEPAISLLLADAPVPLAQASALLVA